jgi:hypothetical protein
VPPIYQPEVAARAIYYAAHHPERREYYVAWSVVEAVVGNKLVPSFADRYLARTGYDSQQYDGAEDPARANNLWEPLPGDHGARGAFSDRAREHSLELWAETHVHWFTAAVFAGRLLGRWRRRRIAGAERRAERREERRRAA